MYSRGVPETSIVNVPLAGQVLAPQPAPPPSEAALEVDASLAAEPLSATPVPLAALPLPLFWPLVVVEVPESLPPAASSPALDPDVPDDAFAQLDP
jgi:hypothetical protein